VPTLISILLLSPLFLALGIKTGAFHTSGCLAMAQISGLTGLSLPIQITTATTSKMGVSQIQQYRTQIHFSKGEERERKGCSAFLLERFEAFMRMLDYC
jgi:hypothetical protein